MTDMLTSILNTIYHLFISLQQLCQNISFILNNIRISADKWQNFKQQHAS